MFYVIDKFGIKYSVLDTDDGIIEDYTSQEIFNYISEGVRIIGVEVENNKVVFKPTRPVENKQVSDALYIELCKIANKATSGSGYNYNVNIRIYYNNEWKCEVYIDDKLIFNYSSYQARNLVYGFNIIRVIGYKEAKPEFNFECNLKYLHLSWATFNKEIYKMKGRCY